MCGSMVELQSTTAEIRRGKKERRKKKPHGKNIMSTSATQGGHNKDMGLGLHAHQKQSSDVFAVPVLSVRLQCMSLRPLSDMHSTCYAQLCRKTQHYDLSKYAAKDNAGQGYGILKSSNFCLCRKHTNICDIQ